MKEYLIKMANKIIINFTLAAAVSFISISLYAQEEGIDRDVYVVRTFEPSVVDASKINILPSLTDTISISPDFSYSILPTPLASDFDVEPITAARMSAETVSKLYGSYIRLGLGSYVTPYGELSINNLRHNNYSGGLYLKHHSSQGKIRLDNNEKAFSQFSDNEMLFYGKRMGQGSVISSEAGLLSNGFHYYGYDTSSDTILEKDDIKQQFMLANAKLGIKSTHTDSSFLNYDISLQYNYFQNRLDVQEHGLFFRSSFDKFLTSQVIGADFEIDYFDNTFFTDTSNLVLKLSPWFNKADDEWEVFAGFHAYYDQLGDDSKLYFHPRASLQFSIIRNYVVPYVGIDGRLNVNNYKSVAFENQFIVPGLFVKNSNTSMDLHAGIKGNFTRNVAFNFRVSYEVYDDMHFFVNDSTGLIGNQFDVIYDDVERLNYTGEIGADVSGRLNLLARVNYYSYNMKVLEHPWHKPELDIRISANYNLRDKILLNADIFYIGERYAKSWGAGQEALKLEGLTDINLGLEYRYNRILSGFISLNNITNNRYYKWNNYPVHGLSIKAGFTYSL